MGKIALLFSGHLRSLNLAIPDWKSKHPEFYDPSVTDVFCHTWSGENKTAWENANKERILSTDLFTIDDLKQHMNVVSYDVEGYDSSPVGEITKQNNYIGTNFSIAYGTKRVYEIFKKYSEQTNTKYDIVIKTRVDTFLGDFPPSPPQPLPIPSLISKLQQDPTKIFIPWYENCDHGGINDQLMIGSMESMFSICCWYFYWLQENLHTINDWHIETNNGRFVNHYKFNIERFIYNLGIIRSGKAFDRDGIDFLGFRKGG